jgi:hypothetical protein
MSSPRVARSLAVVVVAVVGCSLASGARAHTGAPMWSIDAVMSRIDGAKVVIGRWSARVQADTTLCNGEGRGTRWHGERHWRHFTCTWTVFDRKRLVDRDVTFRLHTLTRTRYLINDARFGAD